MDIFTLICPFSPLSPSLWETARYRLKYCLKRPLNPKQPTNQFSILTDRLSFLCSPRLSGAFIFIQDRTNWRSLSPTLDLSTGRSTAVFRQPESGPLFDLIFVYKSYCLVFKPACTARCHDRNTKSLSFN